MFVHTGENLPQDLAYTADLKALGYKVNEDKQIVSIDPPHVFFTRYISSNERVNEKRKEAMHESVRQLVMKELEDLGLVRVYLGGDEGKEILGVGAKGEPNEKHVPIMTTKLENLKGKRDVIVMIGEPGEDAGIWAWRHLLKDGGIKDGSAVGLVKKLAVLGMDSTEVDYKEEMRKKEEMELKMKDLPARDAEDDDSDSDDTLVPPPEPTPTGPPKTPGIIILNPGALIWSYKEKKTMTQPSWLARQRSNALGEDYAVNQTHNYVAGHLDAKEHIETCLDFILPQLVNNDAHLYVVGITNSAEHFIKWYDARSCTIGTLHRGHPDVGGIAAQFSAMAFMQPTHDANNVRCETVRIMLNDRARSWIESSQPLGKFLNCPKPVPMPHLPSYPSTASSTTDLRLANFDDAFTESTTTGLTALAGNEIASSEDVVARSEKNYPEEPIVGDAPVVVDAATSTAAADGLENALESLDLAVKEFSDDDPMASSYNHLEETVNCATYSGETDIDEMLWPNAMDRALGHFKDVAANTARPGRVPLD